MTERPSSRLICCAVICAGHLFALLADTPAAYAGSANVAVCNKSSEKIWYSFAGFSNQQDSFQWRSIGWWSLESAECTEHKLGRLLDRHIFVHGQSSNSKWSGDFLFCVNAKDAFDVIGDYNCDFHGEGFEQRRFFQKTNVDGTFYVNFTD